MVLNECKNQRQTYLDYWESVDKHDPDTGKIDIEDLFIAVANLPKIRSHLDNMLQGDLSITLVVEGSAFALPVYNIDVPSNILSPRNNANDRIILFDISEESTKKHSEYIQNTYPGKNYHVLQSDMMSIGLEANLANLVVNDCAINFAQTDEQNISVLNEISRFLKDANSVCLLTVVVDHRYDSSQYGQDQENVSDDVIDKPGEFSVLPQTDSEKRKCWSVPYYEKLFKDAGFSFTKFDVQEGRRRFATPTDFPISYRRYVLTKQK